MSATTLEYTDAIAPGGNVIHIYGPGLRTLKRMDLNLTSVPFKHSNGVIKDGHGREILRPPYRKLYGLVDALATSRGDLALVLAASLPNYATIRLGARLDTIHEHGDKKGEKYLQDIGYSFATYDVTMDHSLDSHCQTYSASGHMEVLHAPKMDRVAAMHIWRDGHTKTTSPTNLKYDVLRDVASKENSVVLDVLHAAEKA